MNIHDILNKRFSTRNLSDDVFNNHLDDFAHQLSTIDYTVKHSNDILHRDWKNLCEYNSTSKNISSTSRIGMKLCEHFFPNFYNIKDSKGRSFSDLWKDVDLLKKILTWNRKSHSTPYLSELKRGVYFCSGATKSTMYRPQMAKIITSKYSSVFDPCAGWGGRMLGSVSSGCKYYAFEPNTQTYENLQRLISFLNIDKYTSIINDDVLNFNKYDIPKTDVCLTSPPYFDLEIYCTEKTQSVSRFKTYEEWVSKFLNVVIEFSTKNLNTNGISCWNVANVGKYKMWEDVDNAHLNNNFSQNCEYNVVSSVRQVNQNNARNKKSQDRTVQYIENI